MKKPKDSQSNLSKTKNNIRVIVRRLNSKSKQDVCSGNISLNACCKTMVQPKKKQKKKHLAGSCRTATLWIQLLHSLLVSVLCFAMFCFLSLKPVSFIASITFGTIQILGAFRR